MAKPTFLFINVGGDWLSIAQRVKAEGFPVYYYKMKGMTKGREDSGVGIFTKEEIIDDKYEVLNKFRHQKDNLIILYDDNGYGDEQDYLRSEGWPVIGGSAFADKIEYERGLGLNVMKSIGLKLPDEHAFTKFDDAISFLEGCEEFERFVFKPDGEDFAGSSKTYTGKNRNDLIDYIKWIKTDCTEKHYDITRFVLQEFINGIEADFAAYFNGETFMPGLVALDIEEKKTGDGNLGEAIGCMGNVVIFFDQSKYFEEYLKKLEAPLKARGFVGSISINNIFANSDNDPKYEEGMPYGLEFTPRMGWDAHVTECAIHVAKGGKIADFYIALARKKPFTVNTRLPACGVRMFTGSISLKKEDVAGRHFSFDKAIEKNLWYYSVSEKDDFYSIEDNPVMVVNAVSATVPSAIAACYDTIKKLNIPDVYYRKEIGLRANKVLNFLAKYGWI